MNTQNKLTRSTTFSIGAWRRSAYFVILSFVMIGVTACSSTKTNAQPTDIETERVSAGQKAQTISQEVSQAIPNNETGVQATVLPAPGAIPVDPNAIPAARRLKRYLYDNYGKHIISGQMDTAWDDDMDMIARVYNDTGKYPALKGFDYLQIEQPSWEGGGDKQTKEAISWWDNKLVADRAELHGLVSFCWHWRVPLSKGDTQAAEFYTKNTNFRIPYAKGALLVDSPDFAVLKGDMDTVAEQLSILQDAGIPILWRPLHEASGGWFWWGASGPDAYVALWNYMYTYFVEEKGLHNLLWVWNGQNAAWYPGDDTVDFISEDVYPGPKVYSSQIGKYAAAKAISPTKMVALSENGAIPSPEALIADGAHWSWFMTWNDGMARGTHKDNFWIGQYHNENDHKKKLYNHPYVISLDELPDLDHYPY